MVQSYIYLLRSLGLAGACKKLRFLGLYPVQVNLAGSEQIWSKWKSNLVQVNLAGLEQIWSKCKSTRLTPVVTGLQIQDAAQIQGCQRTAQPGTATGWAGARHSHSTCAGPGRYFGRAVLGLYFGPEVPLDTGLRCSCRRGGLQPGTFQAVPAGPPVPKAQGNL